MHHLNVRVAWHDNRWDGTVCCRPDENSFCVDLDRIRGERTETSCRASASFGALEPAALPPCKVEGGAFMNSQPWVREFRHPYQHLKDCQETHGHLLPTLVNVPEYSTFAVPFWWMLRKNQKEIDERLAEPLPPDTDPPFPSAWVFSRERQEALCELFFGRLEAQRSLVTFYTKSGQPIADTISRLVVGIGQVTHISPRHRYESTSKESYSMWDRLFRHSIRPDGSDGLLLPYHEYLEPTGDQDEDERRRDLLLEIAVVPSPANLMSFSHVGELSGPDVTLSTLVAALESVRMVQRQGIVPGPWAQREEWINQQIAHTWTQRGAFPGAGPVLEALGLRLGTALMLELSASGRVGPNDDPWPVVDAMMRGQEHPPQPAYERDLDATAPTWQALSDERRSLSLLLSRFNLSSAQARRWLDLSERESATRKLVSDREILDNPYRIVELDLGDSSDFPISMGVVDRGMLPDSTIAVAHPLPVESCVESKVDRRRVRAALVTVLQRGADDGDTLLRESDALASITRLDLEDPPVVSRDWLNGNIDFLGEEVCRLEVASNDDGGELTSCLQLTDLGQREAKLANILRKRASKSVPALKEDWRGLLRQAIVDGGGRLDSEDPKHQEALEEQTAALARITQRKLTVLVGRAGTGKTTVLGALTKAQSLRPGGVLFLAPTGKARVRLAQKTDGAAMTVAQFLYHNRRYDGLRQRPRFEGDTYRKEKTVVIDESSMLTMDDLLAVLVALDLGHVQRIILVGDPNQLPPIGAGRPFADLVAHLDEAASQNDELGDALARLHVEVRALSKGASDTLRLASWYTRESQPVDADRVLSDLELGSSFNDLSVCYWETPSDLRAQLQNQFVQHLGLSGPDDVQGFNSALGLTPQGWVPFEDAEIAEQFQVLSPVRLHPHGVCDLNRWVQGEFRCSQLKSARSKRGLSLGDEEIVWSDKVILLQNGVRKGWGDGSGHKEYLANGEIGIAALPPKSQRGKFLNVVFAGRTEYKFAFFKSGFGDDGAPLELAYALTVHKAQGSEFGVVFVVVPERCRLLTRELLYTALTRSRNRLVLLLQGKDASSLYEITTKSETARRNTNLFLPGIRDEDVPYAHHLIHRTLRGEMVRSKSELVIANYLAQNEVDLPYVYERPIEGTAEPGRMRPDFSFIDDSGDVIIWEHLGMLDREDYRRGWEWKRTWYAKNGFVEGESLFTTSEVKGLDMADVAEVARKVAEVLQG